jgi:hypothetical protein
MENFCCSEKKYRPEKPPKTEVDGVWACGPQMDNNVFYTLSLLDTALSAVRHIVLTTIEVTLERTLSSRF